MSYEVFCRSVQGAGHIKRGMPCEDHGIKFKNDICTIFALGDGHGDSNCPRSSLGSRYVCEIAVDEMQLFAEQIKNQNWEDKLADKYEANELINQLVTSIFGKWSCKVNEDFAANPLSEKEEAEAKDYIDRYKRGERIEHIYGTTFIAGLLTDQYLLLLQQGDGRCVVFDEDGNATQPIPWDDRCFANVTTSLCDTDAVQSCRYHVIDIRKNKVTACIAGSDGVEDSFASMDKMHTFYREKLLFASTVGIEEFENHLAETLPLISEQGSQDDITVCGIFDRQLVKEKEEKIIAENRAVIVNDTVSKAREHIDSMQPKLSFLYKKCAEAEAQYSDVKNKYAELDQEYASIKRDLDMYAQSRSNARLAVRGMIFSIHSAKCLQKRMEQIKEEKEETAREIKACLDRKKICDEEYSAYKQKYDGYANIIKEHEAENETSGPSSDELIKKSAVTDQKAVVEAASDNVDANASIVEETVSENAADPVKDKDVIVPSTDSVDSDPESIADDSGAAVTADVDTDADVDIDEDLDIFDNIDDEPPLLEETASKAFAKIDIDLYETDIPPKRTASRYTADQYVLDEKETESKSGSFPNLRKDKPRQ